MQSLFTGIRYLSIYKQSDMKLFKVLFFSNFSLKRWHNQKKRPEIWEKDIQRSFGVEDILPSSPSICRRLLSIVWEKHDSLINLQKCNLIRLKFLMSEWILLWMRTKISLKMDVENNDAVSFVISFWFDDWISQKLRRLCEPFTRTSFEDRRSQNLSSSKATKVN